MQFWVSANFPEMVAPLSVLFRGKRGEMPAMSKTACGSGSGKLGCHWMLRLETSLPLPTISGVHEFFHSGMRHHVRDHAMCETVPWHGANPSVVSTGRDNWEQRRWEEGVEGRRWQVQPRDRNASVKTRGKTCTRKEQK